MTVFSRIFKLEFVLELAPKSEFEVQTMSVDTVYDKFRRRRMNKMPALLSMREVTVRHGAHASTDTGHCLL